MTLANTYLQTTNKVPNLFKKIQDGQAPDRVTQQLLKDWGFNSTNDRTFIPMLKALGFLSGDGQPTQRYTDYRDHSRSRLVLGDALKESFQDIFLINAFPGEEDREAIKGKFKSYHNVSDNVATLMTKTFLALLALADIKREDSSPQIEPAGETEHTAAKPVASTATPTIPGLHYNIQIHLPPTKDVEVYNAIFKSLREHLLAE